MGRWHLAAARRTGAEIAAVVDPDTTRASALARRQGGAAVHAALDEALARVPASVVHLCTPTGTHERLARAAIEAGCHVIVEKPLAPTAAATRRLIEAAARRGVLISPCHQFLFQRGVLRACGLAPRLGGLQHLDLVVCSAGADGGSDAARDEIAVDILPHAFALLARLLPDVAAVPWHVLHPGAGELRVFGSAGGTSAAVHVSMRARPTQNVLRIFGRHGTVTCDLFHGFAVVEPGAVSRARKIVRPMALGATLAATAALNLCHRALRREAAYPGLQELVSRFYAAATAGGPSPVDPAETLAVAASRDVVIGALRRGDRASAAPPEGVVLRA